MLCASKANSSICNAMFVKEVAYAYPWSAIAHLEPKPSDAQSGKKKFGEYEPKTATVTMNSSQSNAAKAVAAFEALMADSAFDHTTNCTPATASKPFTSLTIFCAASQAEDSWARRAKVTSQKMLVPISRPLGEH